MRVLIIKALTMAYVAGASYAVHLMSAFLKEMKEAHDRGEDLNDLQTPAGIDRELLAVYANNFATKLVDQLWSGVETP